MAVAGKYRHRRTTQQVDALTGTRAVAFNAFLIILFVGPSLENNAGVSCEVKLYTMLKQQRPHLSARTFPVRFVERFVCWSRLMGSPTYMASGVMRSLNGPPRAT